MTLSRCFLVIPLLATIVSAQIPDRLQGYWYKVNEMSYVHLTVDTVREMPSGTIGKVVKFSDQLGVLLWEDESGNRTAFFKDDELLVKNTAANPPAWLALLKYRRHLTRGSEVTKREIDALAKTSDAKDPEVEKARLARIEVNIGRHAIEARMRENLMRLNAIATIYLLERRDADKVSFAKLKASSSIPNIEPVDGEDYSKLEFGKGVKVLEVTSRSGVTVSINP